MTSESETKHTPGDLTLWEDGRTLGTSGDFSIAVAEVVDHGDLADEAQLRADQARFALTWNCHDDLVGALNAICDLQKATYGDATALHLAMIAAAERARAVLAKAAA